MQTKTNIHAGRYLAITLVLTGLFFAAAVPWSLAQTTDPSAPATSDTVSDLNQQIEAKRQEIERLKQESSGYQKAVDQASAEVRSLESQLTSIENQIALTDVEIRSKQVEIDSLGLEMESLQTSIDQTTDDLGSQRQQLADALRQLDQSSRTPLLTVLLLHSNLNDFYDQAQAVASLGDQLESSVVAIRHTRDELQAKQDQLAQAKSDSEQTRLQLEVNRQSSQQQRDFQSILLSDAESTQSQYNELLQKSVQEEQNANATISALERQLQTSLGGGAGPSFSSTGFVWPVRGTITAYFRDPSYPFRCAYFKNPYCLEHTGVDIGTPQGTPVRATADGVVVALASNTSSALNYISLFHGDGITSRYLHLSKILVFPEQTVKQGDVIGLSGGMPGTSGSGGLTTGPHLHFEMRVNGIADDPLQYLD